MVAVRRPRRPSLNNNNNSSSNREQFRPECQSDLCSLPDPEIRVSPDGERGRAIRAAASTAIGLVMLLETAALDPGRTQLADRAVLGLREPVSDAVQTLT